MRAALAVGAALALAAAAEPVHQAAGYRSPWITGCAVGTLALMVGAHLFMAVVMLLQRPWKRSQRSLFCFVVAKGTFWARVLTYPTTWHPVLPYTAESLAWLAVLAAASVYLDVSWFGRYFLGWEEG